MALWPSADNDVMPTALQGLFRVTHDIPRDAQVPYGTHADWQGLHIEAQAREGQGGQRDGMKFSIPTGDKKGAR